MPCKDITEVIHLNFDGADRLVNYRLTKQTCGAQIGDESLLLDLFAQRSLDELPDLLASLQPDDLPGLLSRPSLPDEAFLYHKHLLALQEAADVLTGRVAGGLTDVCTTSCVTADSHGLQYEGLISIDAVTAKIKACGNCGRCRSPRT